MKESIAITLKILRSLANMPIQHIVLWRLKSSVDPKAMWAIGSQFDALFKARVFPGLTSLHFGYQEDNIYDTYVDRSKGYRWVLNTVFESPDALKNYGAHPEHQKLVGLLNEIRDDVLAIDYEIPAASSA